MTFIPASYGAPDEARPAPVATFEIIPRLRPDEAAPEAVRDNANRFLLWARMNVTKALWNMMHIDRGVTPEGDLEAMRAEVDRIRRAADLFEHWINCGALFEDAKAQLIELAGPGDAGLFAELCGEKHDLERDS